MKTISRGCVQLLTCHCNSPAVKPRREAANARNWKSLAPGRYKVQAELAGSDLFFPPLLAYINPQLLRLFVKMTALEAECLGGIGHVKARAFQFRENYLALEGLHATGQRS